MECACRGLFFVGLVSMLIMAFVGYVRYTCDIYHDFVSVIFLYRRVFDFTVSNVSNVSNLYFSRAYAWHVYRHVSASSIQNRAMYTLWWMMCEIEIHTKRTWTMFVLTAMCFRCCPLCLAHPGFVVHVVHMDVDAWIGVCLYAYAMCAMWVWYLPWFWEHDCYVWKSFWN